MADETFEIETAKLDELIAKFTQDSIKTLELANNLISIVKTGCVPDLGGVKDLEHSIEIMQSDYNHVRNYVRAATESRLPLGNGIAIGEYKQLYRNYLMEHVQTKLANIQQCVNVFLQVRSESEKYMKAILTYQDEARLLIGKLAGEDYYKNIEELEHTTEKYKLFIQAVQTESFGSAEEEKVLELLDDYFSQIVMRGLTLHRYYLLDDKLALAEQIAKSDNRTVPQAQSPDQISADDLEPMKSPNDDIIPITHGDVRILMPTNPMKNKPPSASSFIRDISRLSENAKNMLPFFTHLGLVTSNQMSRIFELSEQHTNLVDSDVVSALRQLESKGFVASYSLPDDILLYCLTPYTYESMQKKSIIVKRRELWDISLGTNKLIAKNEMNSNQLQSIFLENEALFQYLDYQTALHDGIDFEKIINDVSRLDVHYLVSVNWRGVDYQCLLLPDAMDEPIHETNDIILVCNSLPEERHWYDNYKSMFVLYMNVIYKWSDRWIAEDKNVVSADSSLVDGKNSKQGSHQIIHSDVAAVATTAVDGDMEDLAKSAVDERYDEREDQIIHNIESNQNSDKCKSAMWADDASPSEISQALLTKFAKDSSIPEENQFIKLISVLLNSGIIIEDGGEQQNEVIQAVLLAQAASYQNGYTRCQLFLKQLITATALPLDEPVYNGSRLASIFSETEEITEGLMLAAYMHAMMFPQDQYDYTLHTQTRRLFDDYELYFQHFPEYKPLFHKMLSVQEMSSVGFSDAVIRSFGDEAERDSYIRSITEKASSLLRLPIVKTKMNGLPAFLSACFGPNSDLYMYLKHVSENHRQDADIIAEYLKEFGTVEASVFRCESSKLDAVIDKEWSRATQGKSTSRAPLKLLARKQIFDAFYDRLLVLHDWIEAESQVQGKPSERFRSLYSDLLRQMEEISIESGEMNLYGNAVLRWSVKRMIKRLSGQRTTSDFTDLLRTGIFSLTEKGLPIINKELHKIKYYEPWRNMLKHIAEPIRSLHDAREKIFERSSRMFDNIGQLKHINKLLDDETEQYSVTKNHLQEALEAAERSTTQFRELLELAFAYNRISEIEKESLSATLINYQSEFYDQTEYGRWRQFLDALKMQIDESAELNGKSLLNDLKARRATLSGEQRSSILDAAEVLLKKDKNFAVAEEYLNRFDAGMKDIAELTGVIHDADSFSDFVSDKVFRPLMNECLRCKGKALKGFGIDFAVQRMPGSWTTRQIEDSKRFLSSWPSRKNSATASQVQQLFTGIGLNVIRAVRLSDSKEEQHQIYVNNNERNQSDFRHPISVFGTQLKSPINVVFLYGNYTAKQLVDTVCSLSLSHHSIVIIDRPVDISTRRQIAEIFHTEKTGQSPFLMIDQTLALYLALHQVTERLPVMLKCTLPYTAYQPFVRDGGSTPDEMFYGRVKELATIMDPNGACVVYGGRQLGKTALLERAESRCNKQNEKAYAVYINAINCRNESSLVEKIIETINSKTNLQLKSARGIKDFCQQLDGYYRSTRIVSLLLLVDETDNFLDAISGMDYQQLQPFIDLKRQTKNAFKFVLAGLHNVCRAKNATSRNGVFGQLGSPLCIKPLSPSEAVQLLSRPLRYLGFQIDKYPRIETILTNTNYYPGILQFFGYTLVQTLTSDYARYYRASNGNPPFALQDEQLGALMNSADLNRSIRDKFRLSLELDQRYYMLARCITFMYYYYKDTSQGRLGFSVHEIMKLAKEYDIYCLRNESVEGYTSLLDEMEEMGILSSPQSETYQLRRQAFAHIIGSNIDEVDKDIINANSGDA